MEWCTIAAHPGVFRVISKEGSNLEVCFIQLRYCRLHNHPLTKLNVHQYDLREGIQYFILSVSIFLPSSHWVDREEMEWQQARGSEKSGSEGEREKKHVEWEWRDIQGRAENENGGWGWGGQAEGESERERMGEQWPRNSEHSLGQMLHKQPEDLSITLWQFVHQAVDGLDARFWTLALCLKRRGSQALVLNYKDFSVRPRWQTANPAVTENCTTLANIKRWRYTSYTVGVSLRSAQSGL